MNEDAYRFIKAILASITLAILALFCFVTVNGYLSKQSEKANEYFCDGAPIIVQDGDTLYWIARENCVGNIMNVVDTLVNVYGSDIQVGQKIYLPTHPSCGLRLTDGGDAVDDC
jgi:hypothetical protein